MAASCFFGAACAFHHMLHTLCLSVVVAFDRSDLQFANGMVLSFIEAICHRQHSDHGLLREGDHA